MQNHSLTKSCTLYTFIIHRARIRFTTSNCIRTYYSSLTTPDQWEDFNVDDRSFKLVKQKECLNFDSSLYVCKRIFATANDGTKIPMSMVHRKSTKTGTEILRQCSTPTGVTGFALTHVFTGTYYHTLTAV